MPGKELQLKYLNFVSRTAFLTASDHGNAPQNNDSLEEEYQDAEQEVVPCSNDKDVDTRVSLNSSTSQKKRKATRSTLCSNHFDSD
jgi:hypothetical protein